MAIRMRLIDEMYNAEKNLREIATEMQLEKKYWLRPKVFRIISRVYDEALLPSTQEILSITLGDAVRETITNIIMTTLGDLAFDAEDLAYDCAKAGKEPSSCIVEDPKTIRAMRILSDVIRDLTGRRCAFAEWEEGVRNSIVMMINDISSCIHRLADWLSTKTPAVEEEYGECKMLAGSSEAVKRACKAWWDMVDKLDAYELYSDEDVNALYGITNDDRLMLRVGSAAGHATHLDLTDGTLKYYDTDRPVNETMMMLWTKCGLRCEVLSDGVSCIGLTKDNIECAAKVAAAATSMDFRLSDPSYWYREEVEDAMAHELRKMTELILSGE